MIRIGAGNDLVGMRHALPAALLAAAVLAGCGDGGGGSGSGSAPTADTIRIADFKYSPPTATVKAGTPITVVNADDAPHTLTDRSSPRAFDSGTIKGGRSGTVTFTKAGTYDYFCEFHPYMKGKVTVTR